MTEVREIPSGVPPGSDPSEVGHVVETARSVAEQEFDRAERFDRKALNLATVVGAFFSLSQIVVVTAIGNGQIEAEYLSELRWMGFAATVLAAMSVGAALAVFWARKEGTYDLDDLKLTLKAAKQGNEEVPARIADFFVAITETRRASNAKRTDWYRFASLLAVLAITATAVELGIVIFAIT